MSPNVTYPISPLSIMNACFLHQYGSQKVSYSAIKHQSQLGSLLQHSAFSLWLFIISHSNNYWCKHNSWDK